MCVCLWYKGKAVNTKAKWRDSSQCNYHMNWSITSQFSLWLVQIRSFPTALMAPIPIAGLSLASLVPPLCVCKNPPQPSLTGSVLSITTATHLSWRWEWQSSSLLGKCLESLERDLCGQFCTQHFNVSTGLSLRMISTRQIKKSRGMLSTQPYYKCIKSWRLDTIFDAFFYKMK